MRGQSVTCHYQNHRRAVPMCSSIPVQRQKQGCKTSEGGSYGPHDSREFGIISIEVRGLIDQISNFGVHSFCCECTEIECISHWLLYAFCVNLDGLEEAWVCWIRSPVAIAYCEIVERIPICYSEEMCISWAVIIVSSTYNSRDVYWVW